MTKDTVQEYLWHCAKCIQCCTLMALLRMLHDGAGNRPVYTVHLHLYVIFTGCAVVPVEVCSSSICNWRDIGSPQHHSKVCWSTVMNLLKMCFLISQHALLNQIQWSEESPGCCSPNAETGTTWRYSRPNFPVSKGSAVCIRIYWKLAMWDMSTNVYIRG